MTLDIRTDAPPLRREADGTVRIGASRVLLELVIHAYQGGATADEVVQRGRAHAHRERALLGRDRGAAARRVAGLEKPLHPPAVSRAQYPAAPAA